MTTFVPQTTEPYVHPGQDRPRRLLAFARSSIGLKVIMAGTGVVLWLYLLAHIAGNLQMFAGKAAFNGYAAFLKGTAILLWGERLVVFGAIALHALAAYRLTELNRAARPAGYRARAKETSTPMSRTMIVSGTIVLVFFVYHILHFTVGVVGGVQLEAEVLADGRTRPDAYLMVYRAFKDPAIVALYVVGQAAVFAHLLHGSSSLFQSIGAFLPFRAPSARRVERVVVIALFVAAISIPLMIYFTWPAV